MHRVRGRHESEDEENYPCMASVKNIIHLNAHLSLHCLEYLAPNHLEVPVKSSSITFYSFNANTLVSITLDSLSPWIYKHYSGLSYS